MRAMNATHQKNGLGVSEAGQKKALARHMAVCWVNERVSEGNPNGQTLQTAIMEASQKLWDGYHFSAGSIERYYYTYRKEGFQGLLPAGRSDKGRGRVLSAETQEKLLDARRQSPGLNITTLVRYLTDTGVVEPGAFSLSSVYRLFAAYGLDRRSLKAGYLHPDSGPQKAFEVAMPNMLWMADMMYGPTIVTAEGKAIRTRLFALLDDNSRLCPCAQYFGGEGSECFMAVLHEAIRRRGLPDKIYTDNGKVFLCRHLSIVCANLNIKLSRARPYAAWSKGKIERFFRTLQTQFQATLVFDPVHSLAEINARLSHWIENVYHQTPQRGTGEAPAKRFMAYNQAIRLPPPDEELERLFLCNTHRRVRKDATISVGGVFFELTPALRGQQVEARYNPQNLDEVEIWHQNRFVQIARKLNRKANSQNFGNKS
jgi:putative transposase